MVDVGVSMGIEVLNIKLHFGWLTTMNKFSASRINTGWAKKLDLFEH